KDGSAIRRVLARNGGSVPAWVGSEVERRPLGQGKAKSHDAAEYETERRELDVAREPENEGNRCEPENRPRRDALRRGRPAQPREAEGTGHRTNPEKSEKRTVARWAKTEGPAGEKRKQRPRGAPEEDERESTDENGFEFRTVPYVTD